MERPIKTVTTIVRGVPRGQVSFGGGGFTDPRDGEMLAGYPFGGGDLHGPAPARHDDAAADGAGGGERRRLHLVARRSRSAEALLFRAGRDERIASKRSTSTTPGATTSASQCRAWRLGRATSARGGGQPHMAAHRARVRDSRVGDAARRARLDARRRAGHDAPRACTTPASCSTTTRRCSRSCAGWRRRSRADRVLAVHLGVGRPLLLGLSRTTRASDRMGGEAGFTQARSAKARSSASR